MTPGQRFTEIVDGLNDRLGAMLRWLVLIMVLVGAYNAVARYVSRDLGIRLASNTLNELQWYLFSVVFLLGAAYGLRTNAHVRVDVMYERLSEKRRALIDLLGGILFLLPFCILMLWVSWPVVVDSWAIREISPNPGGLPRYPIKALILISFALLLVQGLSQIVKSVAVMRGQEWAMEPAAEPIVVAQAGGDEGSGGAPSEPQPHEPHGGEG